MLRDPYPVAEAPSPASLPPAVAEAPAALPPVAAEVPPPVATPPPAQETLPAPAASKPTQDSLSSPVRSSWPYCPRTSRLCALHVERCRVTTPPRPLSAALEGRERRGSPLRRAGTPPPKRRGLSLLFESASSALLPSSHPRSDAGRAAPTSPRTPTTGTPCALAALLAWPWLGRSVYAACSCRLHAPTSQLHW